MTTKRKSAECRRREIDLAISRIKRGRAHTKATKVNVTTVAKEVGVSTALLYNHYPDKVENIQEEEGRSSRAQRDAKHGELLEERQKNRTLRAEVAELRLQVARLASINEVLVMENRVLKAKKADGKVSDLPLSA
jgi:AcrR family transcriptional regulator